MWRRETGGGVVQSLDAKMEHDLAIDQDELLQTGKLDIGPILNCLRLCGVSDDNRDMLYLRDAYGYSIEEIAAQFNLSPDAVKVRIFRVRQLVRDRLGGGSVKTPVGQR